MHRAAVGQSGSFSNGRISTAWRRNSPGFSLNKSIANQREWELGLGHHAKATGASGLKKPGSWSLSWARTRGAERVDGRATVNTRTYQYIVWTL
ncbi:hypothetical protein DPEC_G00309440 [Dallia pectoralis]|uniref:Uncharacterized protein n=1 Tax=Dallia pectoralis TaxID=75939 RepID=A0ACC2FF81_DALPE|nr:hypothetical protein DPEC_G00309440 [Dallia pectoralis]